MKKCEKNMKFVKKKVMGPKKGLNDKSLHAKLLYYIYMNYTQGIRDNLKGFGDVFFLTGSQATQRPIAKSEKVGKIVNFR